MKNQRSVQRFKHHYPAAGEVVVVKRSWYNCGGLEQGRGYCTEDRHDRFLDVCPGDDQATLAENTFVPEIS